MSKKAMTKQDDSETTDKLERAAILAEQLKDLGSVLMSHAEEHGGGPAVTLSNLVIEKAGELDGIITTEVSKMYQARKGAR